MGYIIRIRNFMLERKFFHSASVASVPELDKQGVPTGNSKVLLQVYMWIPEANGQQNLRKVNIQGHDDRDTCSLYADAYFQLEDELPYTEEDRNVLIEDLLAEVHGEAAAVKQGAADSLDETQENENGT